MSTVIKPMLAAKAPDVIKFPTLASPKLDGIRCLVHEGVAMSRNWKPIPNLYVQKMIGRKEFNGFDGELGVGNPGSATFYRDTMHYIMSEDGEPAFTYWIFDIINNPKLAFTKRISELHAMMDAAQIPYPGQIVDQKLIQTQEELNAYEAECLGQGYEGLIIRDPDGAYKNGRSTAREGGMIKIKRFSDDEAVIIGVQELMKNGNEAEKDAFGRTERSSHKANMIPMGTLGALICVTKDNVEFNIGTGFTAAMRSYLWKDQNNLIGKYAKYKFFDGGNKEAPRFPVFIGFRDQRDMS